MTASAENTFKVNWDHQQNHVLEGLKNLWQQNDLLLTDVTLACEGEYFRAHKLVLSLCSSFFKDLFIKNKADKSNTIIIVGNVSAVNLRRILHFIYQGTTEIPRKDEESFFQAGKQLGIEGLSETYKGLDCSAANRPPKESSQRKFRKRSPSTNSPAAPPGTTAKNVIEVPPKIPRLSVPVVPEVVEEPGDDSSEALQCYDDGDGSDEEDNGIDLNSFKIEPIQVFSGFFDNHHEGAFHDESNEPDSYEASADTDGYLIPDSAAVASPSSMLLPSLPGEQSLIRNNQGTERKRNTCRNQLVWTYFRKLDTAPNTARCKLCSNDLRSSNKSSTFNLRRHLQRKHKHYLWELQSKEKELKDL